MDYRCQTDRKPGIINTRVQCRFYIVPLDIRTTDGEMGYFNSRRIAHLCTQNVLALRIITPMLVFLENQKVLVPRYLERINPKRGRCCCCSSVLHTKNILIRPLRQRKVAKNANDLIRTKNKRAWALSLDACDESETFVDYFFISIYSPMQYSEMREYPKVSGYYSDMYRPQVPSSRDNWAAPIPGKTKHIKNAFLKYCTTRTIVAKYRLCY